MRSRVSFLQRCRSVDVRPWNIAALACLTILTIGYLAFTNANATGGYELRAYERRVEMLREEVRQLELSAIDAQSEEQVRARIETGTFIPVAHVQYLTPDHAVAQR